MLLLVWVLCLFFLKVCLFCFLSLLSVFVYLGFNKRREGSLFIRVLLILGVFYVVLIIDDGLVCCML